MKEKSTNSVKEIGAALNNAVALARTPAAKAIPPERMRRLSAYSLALISPLKEDLEEEFLSPHEAVFVLSAAALLVHAQYVQLTDKLPMLQEAREALAEAEDGK